MKTILSRTKHLFGIFPLLLIIQPCWILLRDQRETIDDFFGKSTKQYTLKDNFTFDGNYELVSDGSIDKYFSRVGFNSDKDQALVYVKFEWYGLSIVFLTKEDGVWKAVDTYTVAIS